MTFPRISIVTPSYNQGHYLEQTICSVLDQGYPNLEYMVVDGGSKDDSVDVIKKYEKHLTWWVSEKDKGQTDAINKGARRCTGDVFGYINSDDLLYPRSLQRVADTWNNGARWICGWSQYLEPEGSDWPYMVRAHGRRIDWFLDNPLPQQSCFFDRKFFETIGYFREDLHYSFDYEYWLRLQFKAKAKLWPVRQCMSAFRLHGESKTMTVWTKFEKENQILFNEYKQYLTPKDRMQLWREQRQWKAREGKKRMWRAITDKDIKVARKEALGVMSEQPLSLDSWKHLFFAMRGH